MNIRWHFRPTHRGDDITDPITGEFFADGSLANPATALVREALQNAMDARPEGASVAPVRVRIGVFNDGHSLSSHDAERWFGSLRHHLTAKGNGLKDAPTAAEPCDFLVVEDFETSGLTGNPESDAADGDRNNFVDFLRSDGRTRKAAGERGSWGVGKNVFPRSSRINAFIAFTVRRDDRRHLVMGKAVLKIRRVGGEQYQPACYMGSSWETGDVPRPTEDRSVEAQLCADFNLIRRAEPGLSVVIPWPDPEISFPDIFRAVVTQFYWAILASGLSVTLVENSSEIDLTRASILEHVRQRCPECVPTVELAQWALSATDRTVVAGPPPDRPQKWSADLVTSEVRDVITGILARRERVAVRIHVHVREIRSPEPRPSFFDIFFEAHDEDQTLAPSFFREQLSISSVKRAVGVPRIRALVIIGDEPLAKLLRAAEPPNHTDWDIKTANFRNAYRDGNHVVTFVKTAVKQLIGYVRAAESSPDPTVTMDFFALADDLATSPQPAPKDGVRPGGNPAPVFQGIQTLPRPFAIDQVNGGFLIRRREGLTPVPRVLHVAMAYDVMLGSPWKQFEPADFDLTRPEDSGLTVFATGGVSSRALEPNRIELKLDGEDFCLRVTGFDPNRDLIVRAYNPREAINADTPPELHEAQEA